MLALRRSLASLLLVLLPAACGGGTQGGTVSGGHDAGPEAPGHDEAGVDADAAPMLEASMPEAQVEASAPEGPGVLLFAGYGPDPLSDTWDWNGSTWTELAIDGPSVRSDQSMIGLGSDDVLLFGGEGLGPYLGDTWTWNGVAWKTLAATGPSPREGAAVAALGGKVYLYGGSGTAGGFLSDTWVWDGQAWTEVTVSGATPGGRYGHSMATLGDKIVLFGNVGGPTDTWTFDGKAWTQAATIGPTGQQGGLSDSRCFQTMATLGDEVILFGGEQDANHILNDTWAWDGSKWTERTVSSPPPARFHAGMTAFGGKLVLFGGAGAPSGTTLLGDTWTWDGSAWAQAADTGPSARYAYVLAAH